MLAYLNPVPKPTSMTIRASLALGREKYYKLRTRDTDTVTLFSNILKEEERMDEVRLTSKVKKAG